MLDTNLVDAFSYISDNEDSDVSSVNIIIEASEPIKGLNASSFTIKNSTILSLTGSDGDDSYSLILQTIDFTSNQNATISIPKDAITLFRMRTG